VSNFCILSFPFGKISLKDLILSKKLSTSFGIIFSKNSLKCLEKAGDAPLVEIVTVKLSLLIIEGKIKSQ